MDFSVVIYQEAHKETLQDLPGVYYAWIENINTKEQEVLEDPRTGEYDDHQNVVWNIDLGLTNFGHLKYMKKIGNLLVRKKKFDKQTKKINEQPDSEKKQKALDKIKENISKLQRKARVIMEKGAAYKEHS